MDFKVNSSNQFDVLASLEEIISSLLSPLTLEELEGKYLNSISRLIPAHATALYFFKPEKKKPVRITASGVDVDFIKYYEAEGRDVDPLRGWITKIRAPYQSQTLLGLEGWRHHPVYNIVKTASIDFAMQSPLIFGQDIIGTLNFGREVGEGAFNETDLKAVSIISRFMSLSVSDSLTYSKKSDFRKRFCNEMDQVRQGIIITDSDYSPQYANSAARIIAERTLGRDDPSGNLKLLLSKGHKEQGESGRTYADNLSAGYCPIPGSKVGQSLVILEEMQQPAGFSRFRGVLSNREVEVLQFVERGMQNKEIASELGISVNTVKRHLDNLFLKMNVNSRTQLVSKVYRLIEEAQRNKNKL